MQRSVTLHEQTWQALHRLIEQCGDTLSNAGCNDFEIPYTSENRDLADAVEARAQGMTVEEWRECADYWEPRTYQGKLVLGDDWLCMWFRDEIQAQALGGPSSG